MFEDDWDLKDVILVDNSTISLATQFNNGVPILSYYNDETDREMIYLYYYLLKIYEESDITNKIKSTFWLEKLKIPAICDSVSGVIEYVVEEIEDEQLDEQLDEQFDEQLEDSNSFEGHRLSELHNISNFMSKNYKKLWSGVANTDHSLASVESPSNIWKTNLFQMKPKQGDSCYIDININDMFDNDWERQESIKSWKDNQSEDKLELTPFSNLSDLEMDEDALNTSKVKMNLMSYFSKTTSKLNIIILGLENIEQSVETTEIYECEMEVSTSLPSIINFENKTMTNIWMRTHIH